MTTPQGFVVIDTETTGVHPGYRHRIAEVATIQLDLDGCVIDEWWTLVNPNRDLGPQSVHGIRAADVKRAPTFEQIAGELVHRVRTRVPVSHNWAFDACHLRAEFLRLGIETPFDADGGVCTMSASGQADPLAGRSLIDCCRRAGIELQGWHTAIADARAAAALFRYLLKRDRTCGSWTESHLRSALWRWPPMSSTPVATVHRPPHGHIEPHFLARMIDRIPRTGVPKVDAYLAMLDNALLDRNISATEADSLVELAYRVGLHRVEVVKAHHGYLREIARAAWADGTVTDAERKNLVDVAQLLGLDASTVAGLLGSAASLSAKPVSDRPSVRPTGLVLEPGLPIVLTGAMKVDRAVWTQRAEAAGLVVGDTVTKKTRLLVAADPDTLSGKAKKARSYDIPVVSEEAFAKALSDLRRPGS